MMINFSADLSNYKKASETAREIHERYMAKLGITSNGGGSAASKLSGTAKRYLQGARSGTKLCSSVTETEYAAGAGIPNNLAESGGRSSCKHKQPGAKLEKVTGDGNCCVMEGKKRFCIQSSKDEGKALQPWLNKGVHAGEPVESASTNRKTAAGGKRDSNSPKSSCRMKRQYRASNKQVDHVDEEGDGNTLDFSLKNDQCCSKRRGLSKIANFENEKAKIGNDANETTSDRVVSLRQVAKDSELAKRSKGIHERSEKTATPNSSPDGIALTPNHEEQSPLVTSTGGVDSTGREDMRFQNGGDGSMLSDCTERKTKRGERSGYSPESNHSESGGYGGFAQGFDESFRSRHYRGVGRNRSRGFAGRHRHFCPNYSNHHNFEQQRFMMRKDNDRYPCPYPRPRASFLANSMRIRLKNRANVFFTDHGKKKFSKCKPGLDTIAVEMGHISKPTGPPGSELVCSSDEDCQFIGEFQPKKTGEFHPKKIVEFQLKNIGEHCTSGGNLVPNLPSFWD